jgi:hypothetical protein
MIASHLKSVSIMLSGRQFLRWSGVLLLQALFVLFAACMFGWLIDFALYLPPAQYVQPILLSVLPFSLASRLVYRLLFNKIKSIHAVLVFSPLSLAALMILTFGTHAAVKQARQLSNAGKNADSFPRELSRLGSLYSRDVGLRVL